jgi:hypothetical protein
MNIQFSQGSFCPKLFVPPSVAPVDGKTVNNPIIVNFEAKEYFVSEAPQDLLVFHINRQPSSIDAFNEDPAIIGYHLPKTESPKALFVHVSLPSDRLPVDSESSSQLILSSVPLLSISVDATKSLALQWTGQIYDNFYVYSLSWGNILGPLGSSLPAVQLNYVPTQPQGVVWFVNPERVRAEIYKVHQPVASSTGWLWGSWGAGYPSVSLENGLLQRVDHQVLKDDQFMSILLSTYSGCFGQKTLRRLERLADIHRDDQCTDEVLWLEEALASGRIQPANPVYSNRLFRAWKQLIFHQHGHQLFERGQVFWPCLTDKVKKDVDVRTWDAIEEKLYRILTRFLNQCSTSADDDLLLADKLQFFSILLRYPVGKWYQEKNLSAKEISRKLWVRWIRLENNTGPLMQFYNDIFSW